MANGANNTGQRLRKIVVSHQPRGEAEERPLLLKQVGRGRGGGRAKSPHKLHFTGGKDFSVSNEKTHRD
jgi:hypothetical protein